MPFDAWHLFIDCGCIAVLLLIGQFIRATVPVVQRLFIPASVIAGLCGLVFGPHGWNLIPFSPLVSQYPSILITLIFASLPFASRGFQWQSDSRNVTELWAYSTAIMCLQWGGGVVLSLALLRVVWPDLHVGFGTLLASGFVGGHGTAAAVGATFAERGWPQAGSLAMTAATVGMLSSIVGGMAWIQWGTRKQATRFVARFEALPAELRTGLIPQEKRKPIGHGTVSAIATDPLIFHFALIAAAALGGFFLGQWSEQYFGVYRIPTFCVAFLCACVVRHLLTVSQVFGYVDRTIMVRLGGSLTDVLVVAGIATINPQVVIDYAGPLLALFAFGLCLCWGLFRLCGPRVFAELWFEKSVFTWGWVTGILAMAIALLRVVDPEDKSTILDNFAVAYIAIGPLEVLLVSLGPVLVTHGYAWSFGLVSVSAGLLVLAYAVWRRPAV